MGLSYKQCRGLGIAHLHPDHPGNERNRHDLAVAVTKHGLPDQPTRAPVDGMNKLERAFWERLKNEFGELAYREGLTFRLAGRTRYTPDFVVIEKLGVTAYEVKGFMRDDASVKLKVAASMFPLFSFVLVTRPNINRWECRHVAKAGISRDVFCPYWLA